MFKVWKNTLISVKKSTRTLFVFEILFKTITMLALIPGFKYLIDLTLEINGYSYITTRNILSCLKNPVFDLMLIGILLLFALSVIYEISIIVLFFGHEFIDQKLLYRKLFILSSKEMKKVLKPRNFLLLLYALCLFPFTNFVTTSSYMVSNIEINEYFLDYIIRSKSLTLFFISFMLVIFIISILLTFVFCYVFLEHKNIEEACIESVRLIKGKVIKTVISLVLCNIIFLVIYIAFYLLVILLVSSGTTILQKQEFSFVFFLSFFNLSNKLVVLIFSSLEVIVHFAFTVHLYYAYSGKMKKKYSLKLNKKNIRRKLPYRSRRGIAMIGAVILLFNTWGIYYVMHNTYGILGVNDTLITSHRGNSIKAPENTLAALDYAVRDMSDYAEIDVQETKDGVIILFHDSNLKRITGINRNIWKVNYDDIKDIDIGSWFNKKFSDQRIPTLDEVLKFCNNKIRLNIELKPHGNEKNLEKSVVSIIEENDFVNQCVITSFNYDSLKKVKKLNPEIKTGYILSAVYGKFYDLKYADFFSIEKSFITDKVVNEAHKRDKEVFAWTINSASYMKKMAKLGVDNIITDNPVKARKVIYSSDIPNYTLDFLKLIFEY
ncbi:glycerophosphodiester phosphodiesterase [Anaeromicropila herbilytica]|uniref:Glycerophosphoryl diester phosphodiesterase n=1 Tax=Anaeromicropila herbilytica TaxID=2785025 RepID=A0A7R7IBC8_9FIRM|nr:glycerophosphodiester phosphodiesterase [Anaeromicropila herbilytica]BCN29493.1 glycerophosphoryl diester phosphodiesterase [Anaeromicropila herbilytica]